MEMDIKEIIKNAPEGAASYKAFASKVEYYGLIGGNWCFYAWGPNKWKVDEFKNYEDALTLPKIKTEYRQEKRQIWDLEDSFNTGDLYLKTRVDKCEKIGDIVTLARALNAKACFHRFDEIIDEREEFIEGE